MKTNRMRIIFTAVFAFILMIGFGVNAQDKSEKHDPAARAKKQTEKMKTELNLTPDQISKVESINLSYAQKMKTQKEQMRAQMKNLREEKDREMAAVLTKEQMEKHKAMKAEHKGKKMQGKDCCKKKK